MKNRDVAVVMKTLRTRGKPGTAKIYRRHGVKEETCGLSYADLGRLVKEIGIDHALALGLWRTGVHDARVLATKVVDPARVTRRDIDRWISDARNYIITDAVAGLAARSPLGPGLAGAWVRTNGEWRAAAGWNVYGLLALEGRLEVRTGRALIAKITKGIARAPNRVRHSMNGALIALGSMEELRGEALAAANAIGTVEVDHGETGCKTPDAAGYIERMAARSPRRTRVTGPRMRAQGPGRRRRATG